MKSKPELEQDLEATRKTVAELEEQLEEFASWKPKKDEAYWSILGHGDITRYYCYDDDRDLSAHAFGNCFKTEEEAESARDQVKALLLSLREGK